MIREQRIRHGNQPRHHTFVNVPRDSTYTLCGHNDRLSRQETTGFCRAQIHPLLVGILGLNPTFRREKPAWHTQTDATMGVSAMHGMDLLQKPQ